MNVKVKTLVLAAIAALGISGSAKAASLINVEVLGSTSQGGTYTSDLSSLNLGAGSTIYYRVLAVANPSASNSDGKSTNGTTDSANSLLSLSLTDGDGTFATGALSSTWNGTVAVSNGTNGGSSITDIIAQAAAGNYVSLDGLGTIVYSGTFTVGSGPESISASVYSGTGQANGVAKFSGALTPLTNPQSTTDPLVGFSSLTVTSGASPVPEPTSCAVLMLAVPALLMRRRRA